MALEIPTYAQRTAHLDAALVARREMRWANDAYAREEKSMLETNYNAFSIGWACGRQYASRQVYLELRRNAVGYAREFKRAFYASRAQARV